MAIYQCSCGVSVEMEPEFGGVITSAYHLHRATRLDGTSAIVRMGEILAPAAADLKTSDQSARARRARRIERRTSAGRVAVPEEHEQMFEPSGAAS